jgi:hypothetical protein
MAARRGRQPKGERAQILARVPKPHRHVYEQRAAEQGIPLGDYVALVLAQAHELAEPDYINRDRRQGELPLGA